MAESKSWQKIPTNLPPEQFEEFVLPHLKRGTRGLQPKLSLHAIFNYILKLLYLGCQWKALPIEKDKSGKPEIHYTRIYSAFRRFEDQGCFDAIFAGFVSLLHLKGQLDLIGSTLDTKPATRRPLALGLADLLQATAIAAAVLAKA